MSHLAGLRLSHFRSHLRGGLELDGRPVVFFGPNGAGKTNILEAVSLLSPGRGLRRAGTGEIARRPESIGWRVEADLVSPARPHEIELRAEPESPRRISVDGKNARQSDLGRIVRVLWLTPAMDRLWIEGAEGRRRFLDRATLSFEPAHADETLGYEKAMRERNKLLKDRVGDPRWYAALEAQMARHGARIIANRAGALAALSEAQDSGGTVFPRSILEVSHPEGELPESEEGLAEAFAAFRPRDLAAGRALAGPHRVDLEATHAAKGVSARLASTGEQKALLISLVLANVRALAERLGAPPLLLLDEVSAHLDADHRAALYEQITALGAQAWMTGTGPELFEELENRATRVKVTDDGGESRMETVT